MTIQELVDELTKDLNLTTEQQFRVTAKVKRMVHHEKAFLMMRLAHYAEGTPIFDHTDPDNAIVVGREEPKDAWLYDLLLEKEASHQHWACLPDEELVTWDVGSHKYKGNK